MRLAFFLLAGLGSLVASGCGGNAVAGTEPPPGTHFEAGLRESGADAPSQDVPAPYDAPAIPDGAGDAIVIEAAPDVSPSEFCTGAAPKLQVGGNVYISPALTTSLVIMDCCDGVTVRFHVKQQLGYNVSLMLRAFGLFTPGSYVLGDEPGGMEASASKEGDFNEWADAKGTVHVDTDYPQPRIVGFCLETQAGDVLPAMRMYVPQVLTAPYEWDLNWSLYLLADPSIKATDAVKQPIGSLALASQPVVHLMSIAYYEQSTHKAVWDSWYTSQALLNTLPQVGLEGLPFVAVAGGERVYVGAFITPISSFMVDAPSIDTGAMPEDGFNISAKPSPPDLRADPRILKALGEAVKLAP